MLTCASFFFILSRILYYKMKYCSILTSFYSTVLNIIQCSASESVMRKSALFVCIYNVPYLNWFWFSKAQNQMRNWSEVTCSVTSGLFLQWRTQFSFREPFAWISRNFNTWPVDPLALRRHAQVLWLNSIKLPTLRLARCSIHLSDNFQGLLRVVRRRCAYGNHEILFKIVLSVAFWAKFRKQNITYNRAVTPGLPIPNLIRDFSLILDKWW